MIGYKTAATAYSAAKRRGKYGVTDSGRQCCPVQLPDGSWVYWTDHSYFRPQDDSGTLLFPEGKEISPVGKKIRAMLGDNYEEWMAENLFSVWK